LGVIEKGESYTYCSGIWDSRPSSFKTCPDCMQLRFQIDLALVDAPHDEGVAFEGMLEWLQECNVEQKQELADAFGKILKARRTRWRLSESSRRLFSLPPEESNT
jgi:hypothetical protein